MDAIVARSLTAATNFAQNSVPAGGFTTSDRGQRDRPGRQFGGNRAATPGTEAELSRSASAFGLAGPRGAFTRFAAEPSPFRRLGHAIGPGHVGDGPLRIRRKRASRSRRRCCLPFFAPTLPHALLDWMKFLRLRQCRSAGPIVLEARITLMYKNVLSHFFQNVLFVPLSSLLSRMH
jgi:hypothetical protein